ncbi:MAG: ThuA domain-containing protein [Opitutales bacterium]|nr:ThuA domain-containing protein [Opitutales bacterium]
MNYLKGLSLFLVVFSSVHVLQAKIRVLLIDGQNNHNWKATTPVMVNTLESSGHFNVTVSTSPPKKSEPSAWKKWNPKFNSYDVTLSNYNGEMWPKEVQDNLINYVQGGGSFVVVHAANNAFGQWKEYNQMIGLGGWGGRNEKSGPYLYFNDSGKLVRDPRPGRGGSHGPQSEFIVQVRDFKHSITKGMPKKWLHSKDELYDSLRGPAEKVKILATAYSEKSKKHEPIIMVISYGKGRVFHTPMGHADYSMKCIGFQEVLRRGTEWAATGQVTSGLPLDFPTEEKVSSQ